jgi:hypothetical protein
MVCFPLIFGCFLLLSILPFNVAKVMAIPYNFHTVFIDSFAMAPTLRTPQVGDKHLPQVGEVFGLLLL